MKRIGRFTPAEALGRDRAERHYVEVHTRFARRMFRGHGDLVTRYATNVAVTQYDLSGHFDEEPSAWRFVIVEVDDDMPNASAFIPAQFQELIWQDHQKCIENIDGSEVDEDVVVDKRSGQLTMVKYLFIYAATGVPGATACDRDERSRHYRDQHMPALTEIFRSAYGSRLYISNTVQREAATKDDFGSGAAYTGGYRSEPKLLAIEEFYFDNTDWGDEFFSSTEVLSLMRDSPLGRVEGYKVIEAVGVDKR